MLLFVLIGGTQTAWGPLVGSLFFTLIPELLRVGGSWRYVVFGVAIVLMMVVRPEGIVTRALVARLSPRNWWPGRRPAPGGAHAWLTPILELAGVVKRFGGLTVIDDICFDVPRGAQHGADRPERRGQDDALQPDLRRLSASMAAASRSTASPSTRCPRGKRVGRGWRGRSRTSG